MNIEEFKTELNKVQIWYDGLTKLDLVNPLLLYKKDELFIALAYIVANNEKELLQKETQILRAIADRHKNKENKLYKKFNTFRSAKSRDGIRLDPMRWVNLILYKNNILSLVNYHTFKYISNSSEQDETQKQLLHENNGYIHGILDSTIYVENKYQEIKITQDLRICIIHNDFLILNTNEGDSECIEHTVAPITAHLAQFKNYQAGNLRHEIGNLKIEDYHKLLRTFNTNTKDMVKAICMLHSSPILGTFNEDILPILYKTLACYISKDMLDNAFEQYHLTKSIKHIELILTGEIDKLSPINYEPTTFDLI